MKRVANLIDGINQRVGHMARWLVLFMVLVQFGIVVGRYVFGMNSIATQEIVLYMHATLFMLAAGYTLLFDKHVRVDVFYAKLGKQAQRKINLLGHLLFLIPTMLALLYWSWPSVFNSWKILEGPISVGGLRAVFLLKSLIPLFCILLLLQSIASVVKLLNQRAI